MESKDLEKLLSEMSLEEKARPTESIELSVE